LLFLRWEDNSLAPRCIWRSTCLWRGVAVASDVLQFQWWPNV